MSLFICASEKSNELHDSAKLWVKLSSERRRTRLPKGVSFAQKGGGVSEAGESGTPLRRRSMTENKPLPLCVPDSPAERHAAAVSEGSISYFLM